MQAATRGAIEELLCAMLNNIIQRRVVTEPFNELEVLSKNPFGARVVPMEVWKGSKFERSFVTSLGQTFFEQIAKLIAEDTGATAINQYTSSVQINTFRSMYINDLLTDQRTTGNERVPNWTNEVTEMLNLNNRDLTSVDIISDLYVRRANNHEEFYSLKTVKPNLDQTEIAKRSMLRLKAFNSNYDVFFALPYNPAGEGVIYRRGGHSVPYRLFNMDLDDCVLIGAEFWNQLGQNTNTYNELLEIFDRVGQTYSIPRILNDYF